ncbi:MAG: hypothetical protein ABIG55_04220 [Candidatus Omnitrophota bacterium]|nr:hypothetical protein [Candidatus Omnitrophota bacterium]
MNKNVIALGAENKNTFSVISDGKIYVSGPVGSLTELDNYRSFGDSTEAYMKKNGMVPDHIACDMHPDYLSTSLAEDICRRNKGSVLVKVQHHHAHIVSCMEDNGIDEEVIGISFDGTGYGSDGASWGGEFMLCTRKAFSREYHLKYVPVPGGDLAAKETWRTGLAYLYQAYGKNYRIEAASVIKNIEKYKIDIVEKMIDGSVNCPRSSSMGRLFDAVSFITGICSQARFEGESAMLLENAIYRKTEGSYGYGIDKGGIDMSPAIIGIMNDVKSGMDKGTIAAKFHNTIGEMVFRVSVLISEKRPARKVLISGGCFQNKYLVAYLENRFAPSGLELFKHKKYSTTDLGVSIGQAVIAANM